MGVRSSVDGMTIPAVLLHGARSSRTMWHPQLEALARAGRTAVAIDLPGHGRRSAQKFTVDACLDAIDTAVDGVGGRAVVVGLSLGGYVGIAHAARSPDRVAGLVAAGCCSVPDQPLAAGWQVLAAGIARLPDKGAWLNQRMVDLMLPPEMAAAAGEGGFALDVMVDLLAGIRGLDPIADLRRIRSPVWLVNGQWDHFRLQEKRFLSAAPDARLVVVRGASHLVSLTRPVAFTRVLLEALAEVDRREDAPLVHVGARRGRRPAPTPARLR